MKEIERYRKENGNYIIQLKDKTENIETLKKERDDIINKCKIIENERNNYKSLNDNLNYQINQKSYEVSFYDI